MDISMADGNQLSQSKITFALKTNQQNRDCANSSGEQQYDLPISPHLRPAYIRTKVSTSKISPATASPLTEPFEPSLMIKQVLKPQEKEKSVEHQLIQHREQQKSLDSLKSTLTTKQLKSVSPLQQRANKKQIQMVDDPNYQLRNAQKGIVANAVRQSLQFKSSIDKHDYSRERQLFGKTFKDIQNEDLQRLSGQHNMNTKAIMN